MLSHGGQWSKKNSLESSTEIEKIVHGEIVVCLLKKNSEMIERKKNLFLYKVIGAILKQSIIKAERHNQTKKKEALRS